MRLPTPRGRLSIEVCAVLAGDSRRLPPLVACADRLLADPPADVLADDDVQLTLQLLYELHYRGFDGVDPDWE